MRKSHRIAVALAAWAMLAVGTGSTTAQALPMQEATLAAAARSDGAPPAPPLTPERTAPPSEHPAPPRTTGPPPTICPANGIPGSRTELPDRPLQRYYLDDPRLGPEFLPKSGAVGELLRDYNRLDSFSATAFIACFWDPAANMNVGGWRFPPNDGFADGRTTFDMVPGQVLDRFGSNNGRFFSPFGVPYAQRALPPSNLDTLEPRYPFDYHVFKVLKPFTVEAGIASPWFGQPGGGMQYRSPSMNAGQLIDGGFLQPLN
ncbi:TNT domain-containing protein [Saccharopolyspora shandongensis]|uniref:TNT domain-containing protein n=1 Tax=Saccharopolyspora shandongensis TaxID=418495 RepID=UPI0034466BD8